MMNKTPPAIVLAILAFNIWISKALFITWMDAPVEKWTWVVFLIWIIPIFFYWIKFRNSSEELTRGNTVLLSLSLVAIFLSVIGSINALAYIGLAFALIALVPWSWFHILWFLTAASWMPALGWFYTRLLPSFSPSLLFGGRLALAIVGMLSMLYALKSKKERLHG